MLGARLAVVSAILGGAIAIAQAPSIALISHFLAAVAVAVAYEFSVPRYKTRADRDRKNAQTIVELLDNQSFEHVLFRLSCGEALPQYYEVIRRMDSLSRVERTFSNSAIHNAFRALDEHFENMSAFVGREFFAHAHLDGHTCLPREWKTTQPNRYDNDLRRLSADVAKMKIYIQAFVNAATGQGIL